MLPDGSGTMHVSSARYTRPRGRARSRSYLRAKRLRQARGSSGSPQLEKHYEVAINPVIKESSETKVLGPEACLSLPDMAFLVRRSATVDVEYTNDQGSRVRAKMFGLPGVVFQHELDHLDGVLALDRDVASLAADDPARERAMQKYAQEMRRHYGEGSTAESSAVSGADLGAGRRGGVDGRDMIRRFAEDMGEDPGKWKAGGMGSWTAPGGGAQGGMGRQ